MSSGKFSQPRPHREEERQIEESFRQLTEDKNRRKKKIYNVEEDIQKTVQEISAQEVPLPEELPLPFQRSAKLEETVQVPPEQIPVPRPAQPPVNRIAKEEPSLPENRIPRRLQPENDLIPKDLDAFFENSREVPEEPDLETEPDFIDKLLKLWTFFQKHQTPAILALCGAALLLIVLFVSIFFTGGNKEPEPVLGGNVFIAGVNIEGMTQEEAEKAVAQVTDTAYQQKDMVVDLGSAQLTFSQKDTGARLDVQAVVDAAFALPSSQSPQYVALLPYLQLNTDYIYTTLTTYAANTGSTLTQTSYGLEGSEPVLSADRFQQSNPTQTLVITMGTPGVGFDAKHVYEQILDAYSLHQFLVEVKNVESVSMPDPIDLDAIYEEFYIAPVNASVNLQNFETIPGSYGYEFDLEQAKLMVAKAQHGEVLRIPMEYIAPEVLDNQAFFQDPLGEYQTPRGIGDDNRIRNLELACQAIDGTVLNPGESLSFHNSINRISGFRMAPEDAGREETDMGGVTQVASTLYYASLLSDLNVSARSNHSYLPSFIDYGLDATADLTIVNTTGYPIRIDAQYIGGYVKVAIMGTEERSYYVMLESSISSSTAPMTFYEDYPYDNAEGYLDGDVIQEGNTGYLIKTYKVKYDRSTGRELSRDFMTNSQYPASDRIIARVEAAPTEPPVTVPPVTQPPATQPPVTEPPATQPPVTQPPVTEPPATQPPVTEPPVPSTEPAAPATEPPAPAESTPAASESQPADQGQMPSQNAGEEANRVGEAR